MSCFVFSRRKKLIQLCNNLRVSKWWQNFHFWVKYPFKGKGGGESRRIKICDLKLSAVTESASYKLLIAWFYCAYSNIQGSWQWNKVAMSNVSSFWNAGPLTLISMLNDNHPKPKQKILVTLIKYKHLIMYLRWRVCHYGSLFSSKLSKNMIL